MWQSLPKLDIERERRMKKNDWTRLIRGDYERRSSLEDDEDDSFELLVDQEVDYPDCQNSNGCCLFLSGLCNGMINDNCPDCDY